MQRASLSPSPDHLAPEMVRMNSDDVQEQDRLTPFLASGLIPVAVVPTTTQFGPSRGESPSTQPSTSARHALVTPIAHLALEQFSTSIPVCMDALTPEKRPIRKPPTKTMVPKATRVVPDFAAFAATLSDCVEKGEYRLELTADGAGGTYFVKARASDITIAVFKPAIQEIGEIENPRGNMRQDEKFDMSFRPGEGYKRERLAYLLDHGHFAGVPETCFTEVHGECGSLQKFVPSMMQTWSTTPAKFDTASVQRIAVFDIRSLNADRHGGNMLVRRDAPSMCVVPIDHGYILPDGWCDPDFEWLLWPQSAAQVPDDIRDYVARLDCDADAALVSAELGDACGEVIAVTTKLLQVALRHGKRYTMRDVGNFCRRQHATQPSGLEALMTASRRDLDEGGDLDMGSVVLRLESAFP